MNPTTMSAPTYFFFRFGCILFLVVNLFSGLQAQEDFEDFSNLEVIIKNETAINTDGFEYSPAFYENGIVFISTRVATSKYKIKDSELGENIMSIFIARRGSEGQLMEPVPFAESLLSKAHEGPLTFNRTNDQIFFTRNNINEKGKKIKAKDGKVKLKIYSASGSGSSWGNIQELPFNGDEFNTAHPSISVDGDRLYFASDREGGFGGMDLYVSEKQGSSWGAPQNLGPDINTGQDEVFPYIHADGTLYFASKGHGSMGGLDIFFSIQEEEDSWMLPRNFEPLNSGKDDFGLILDRDKRNGYLSSNGRGGIGEDDLFSFHIVGDLDELTKREKEMAQSHSVIVIDEMTGAAIAGAEVNSLLLDEFTIAKAITASDGVSGDNILLEVPFDESSGYGNTDLDGEYALSLEPGNYIFKIQKDGYQTKRVVYNTEDAGEERTLYVNLREGEDEVLEAPGYQLENGDNNYAGNNNQPGAGNFPARIEEGTVFRLPNIYYNFNDATIRPDAQVDLDYLADFMLKYPDVEIELASHTDARGSKEYNRDLSQRRAENATEYLTSLGVSADRIRPVGYGESRLRNGCTDGVKCSEEQHQYNRRTEVRILKMDGPIDLTIVNDPEQPKYVDYPSSANKNNNRTRTTTNEKGPFQVVAGVFGVYDNAQARLDLLLELGYSAAEISYSESRRLHTIVVDVLEDKLSAQDVMDRLSQDGIESFMRKM